MRLTSTIRKMHKRSPKLGKAVSLATATGVIAANSFGGSIPLWLMGVGKVITGASIADKAVIKIATHWISSNSALIDNMLPRKDWRINLPDDIHTNGKYLLVSNHQSWVDTSIVQYIGEKRLPLTRFFTKFELIYIPIVGQAFYFLDFPMMRRHSKEAIAKNPALKGKDIEEAKRACALLKDKPFTLLNYLEGTRFTKAKQAQQKSPYKHLLKPRAGGLSLAISALGEDIDGILDMTIVYPDGVPSYGDLWKGNIKRLGVDLRYIDIPDALFESIKQGGYENDEDTKAQMFDWVEQVWRQKDERISTMLADFETNPKAQDA
ncbi:MULTISPECIES: acyltransferase [Psychrobacter]|jgi:1-acyl-sn-glycerol-3-phosphate acyltransferase|uniref:acyltransferase n=1 Tax=Psychrobacter TaxID=497 RepID=UPI00086F7609|nr:MULTISPECIES: acyltransferase [Psychrobacter]MBA6244664.1 acyltransferase [Psychrobacter sp. Urea-trap-18]MBA6285164.1 acyltransferase [Psychrobacter sp. Urea-trap-16]MBA6319567.1 acyltransferase [Psychrobacter sp. Urea-trap-20]MBA6334140.1 acyltransferase [Psychrobacter sp. Urea-trap-19]OEH67422.1 MAG: acyltransferase [Psychrobacter sp. B29-1]